MWKHSLSYLFPVTGGQVFSWGQNQYGQLGLGINGPSISTPQIIQSLQGIPFAQLSAGGAHSFALTLSGAVFGWGRNKFGQLGLNDTNGGFSKRWSSCEQPSPEPPITVRRSFSDRCFPALLKSLRSQRVIYICCGEDHTSALTKVSLFDVEDLFWVCDKRWSSETQSVHKQKLPIETLFS